MAEILKIADTTKRVWVKAVCKDPNCNWSVTGLLEVRQGDGIITGEPEGVVGQCREHHDKRRQNALPGWQHNRFNLLNPETGERVGFLTVAGSVVMGILWE